MTLPLSERCTCSSARFSETRTVGLYVVRMLLLLVELVSIVRTDTFRHSGAFAWNVLATSRNDRFASNDCTLPNDAVGTYCRNSSAFCGCGAHAATNAMPGASRCHFIGYPLFFLGRRHLMPAGPPAQINAS